MSAREQRTNAFTTAFLRCPNQFVVLGAVAGFLVENDPHKLKILQLGCSSGAESYSIASELLRCRPEVDFSIQAFDIEDRVLEIGRSARYTSRQVFKNPLLTPEFVDFTFTRDGDGYLVKKEIAERVTFRRRNILDPVPPDDRGSADIVYAQNFLYHLEPADAEAAFDNLFRMLGRRAAFFIDGMDLPMRTRLTRHYALHPVESLIQEIHEDARSERGVQWPNHYWTLEPLSKNHRDWRRRYCTVFTTVPMRH